MKHEKKKREIGNKENYYARWSKHWVGESLREEKEKVIFFNQEATFTPWQFQWTAEHTTLAWD